MPIFRHTSSTAVPSSACFSAKAIWSSLNLLFFMACLPSPQRENHAGILLPNATVSWDRVIVRCSCRRLFVDDLPSIATEVGQWHVKLANASRKFGERHQTAENGRTETVKRARAPFC